MRAAENAAGEGNARKRNSRGDARERNSRRAQLPVVGHLQLTLTRYAVILGMQMAQTAACNRLHEIGERLSCWLLMAADRVESSSLPVTHDFLATNLGTDRPSVSLAAKVLQRRKIIHYQRGTMEILNRQKLESTACECYRVIRQFNEALHLK